MTNLVQLSQMEAILAARYEQQQQSFQRLVAREMRVRNDIARLNENLLKSRAETSPQSNMRLVGADIAWQGWVGRNKATLNNELAQILAIKEHHLKQVRTAYGKLIVAKDLVKQHRHQLRKIRSQDVLSRTVDIACGKLIS